jgi:hypothetical protein
LTSVREDNELWGKLIFFRINFGRAVVGNGVQRLAMRSAGLQSSELSNWHLAKPLRFVFIFSFLKAKPKV